MKFENKVSFIALWIIFILCGHIIAQNTAEKRSFNLTGNLKTDSKLLKPVESKDISFQDNMNGDNSISGLSSRGWIVSDLDGDQTRPTWFQGNFYDSSFSAFEGPIDGYVASDWLGGDTSGVLDHWLISPQLTVEANDTISFWVQGGSFDYPDSFSVYLSPDGGSAISDFSIAYDDGSLTQRFLAPVGFWGNWRGIIPDAGTVRIAIRYHTRDTDLNSWYIGIDLVEILTSGLIINFGPDVTTNAATNITSTSARLNGTINPNGANTTYSFEWGTSASYGNTISIGGELTGNNDINVNADLSDLAPGTTYHYRVTATNVNGTNFGEDVSFTTSSTTSDIDLEWRTLTISTLDWKVGSSISADLKVHNNGGSASPSFAAQLFLSTDTDIQTSDTQLGSPLQFAAIPAGDSSTLNSVFTVPSINNGIYYIGAIVDVNNEVSESNESNNNYFRRGKVIVGYTDQLQLSHNLAFNDPEQSTSYRMIGIPGNSNLSLSQVLGGTHGEDWTAYHDNGNTNDYLVEFDGTATFNLSPGKGFWVLSNNPITLSSSATPVELESIFTSNQTYEIGYPIQLQNGWNIISNPFEINTDWVSVQNYNGITESLHDFNGNYSNANAMQPYKGYYFFNATNLTELFIPYIPISNLPKKGNDLSEIDIPVLVELVESDTVRSSMILGSTKGAKTGYDKNDRYAPPGDFADFMMLSKNEKLETDYKSLQMDIRENISNQAYDIEVKSPKNRIFQLKIEFNKKSLSGNLVYLIDQNSKVHQIDESDEITLKSSSELNKMQILAGDKAFIESQLSQIIPNEYYLAQNYPNPFNPVTTIRYSIPLEVNSEYAMVNFVIFDVLGREVTTLVNQSQAPGNYEVIFDASEYGSGVYFYELTAGTFKETKKMVLLK